MWGVLRRVIVLLSVLAFVSGMTTQAMPSAEAMGFTKANAVAKAEPECPRMAMDHSDRGVPKPLPCKGIMPDCVKQMGCLGSPSLPERSDALYVPVSYRIVTYWLPSPVLSGRDIEPDLFPPIEG
jgi:hypothetical protein